MNVSGVKQNSIKTISQNRDIWHFKISNTIDHLPKQALRFTP